MREKGSKELGKGTVVEVPSMSNLGWFPIGHLAWSLTRQQGLRQIKAFATGAQRDDCDSRHKDGRTHQCAP